jgi:hypothetical protein
LKKSDLSCKDLPPWPNTSEFGTQLEIFLHKDPFASSQAIVNNFLTIKDILQRELGMRNSATLDMLMLKHQRRYCEILQEPEVSDFNEIVARYKSWFQYVYPWSITFA